MLWATLMTRTGVSANALVIAGIAAFAAAMSASAPAAGGGLDVIDRCRRPVEEPLRGARSGWRRIGIGNDRGIQFPCEVVARPSR